MELFSNKENIYKNYQWIIIEFISFFSLNNFENNWVIMFFPLRESRLENMKTCFSLGNIFLLQKSKKNLKKAGKMSI